MRARPVSETAIDLDKHRGMAAQKATDIRRVVAEVEANATLLRERQSAVEIELLSVPAANWPDAVGALRLEPMRPVSHRLIPIIATSLNPCWRI